MNEVFKKVLLLAGIPLVIALLCMFGGDSALISLFIIIVVPGAYGFIALVTFILGHRTWAKAFLLSMGIILLIGFSVCSLMMSNMNFNGH
ncbi:hypothetical protein F0L74_06725 [Chitinophaga agrisoli]|uniref:Uncharacterized protein n=1 Tax=Chitinophaga agrisoli TaxID=2607653 RepID=A0A5B2W3E4_9BACT|nr:hypothetical protein [Chitinophaga agrisoli]KAA2245644.1 hypothetical protein F0L74_06725 [Chitinophaga agrisoli]